MRWVGVGGWGCPAFVVKVVVVSERRHDSTRPAIWKEKKKVKLASLWLALLCNLCLASLQTHDNKRARSASSASVPPMGLHFLHIPFPRPGLSMGTCRRSLWRSSEWNVFPSAVCVHTCRKFSPSYLWYCVLPHNLEWRVFFLPHLQAEAYIIYCKKTTCWS